MTSMLERIDALAERLSPRDAGFLRRVYGGDLARYDTRLAQAGMCGHAHVLDAGCGFGQWTKALAGCNARVSAVDIDASRLATAKALLPDIGTIDWQQASITALPFPDAHFDAVFSYSVIYYADPCSAIAEFARILKPGGHFYICSNGPGWYLYNIIKNPNPTSDLSLRRYGLRALADSLAYRLWRKPASMGGSVITTRRWLSRQLEKQALHVVACGAEGTVALPPGTAAGKPFFPGSFWGLEAVSEWLGYKT